ncbi:hypothetical protein, partial [Sporisorium scitamineum]
MSTVKRSASKEITLYGAVSRPDSGNKAGRPIRVSTNLFLMQIKGQALVNVQLISVEITPIEDHEKTKRPQRGPGRDSLPAGLVRDVFVHALRVAARDQIHGITQEFADWIVFDGRALAYTVVPIPAPTIEWEVDMPPMADLPAIPGTAGAVAPPTAGRGRGDRRFKVKLTNTGRDVNFQYILNACQGDKQALMLQTANPSETIMDSLQAIDIAAARKFFDVTRPIFISQGAEILPGFFQSARPCAAGLVINLDPAYSPFVAS